MENIENNNIQKKKTGGRTIGSKNKVARVKYILEYNNKTYQCISFDEISKITGISRSSIFRIYKKQYNFKKRTSEHLKNIIIKDMVVNEYIDIDLN